MVSTLRVEDKLEGPTNFWAWKARILLLLKENDPKDYVEMVTPYPNDAQELATHGRKEVNHLHKYTLLTASSTRGSNSMYHEDMHQQMQTCRRLFWFYGAIFAPAHGFVSGITAPLRGFIM
jgi:hypothetical protein